MEKPESDDVGVGAVAPVMGHSWAVFLAHSCLVDVMEQIPPI